MCKLIRLCQNLGISPVEYPQISDWSKTVFIFALEKELLYATERELEIPQTWFDVSKWSLKIKKTKLKVVGNWKVSDGDIDFDKNQEVVIDHIITWKQHTVYGKQSCLNLEIYENITACIQIINSSLDILLCGIVGVNL